MNILHLEAGLNWGGQEFRTLIETAWLIAHGHRAWVACSPEGQMARHAKEMGLPMLLLPMRQRYDVQSIWGIRNFCIKEKVDVLHCHGSKDAAICLPFHAAGWPVVRSRHLTVAGPPKIGKSLAYRFGSRKIVATSLSIKNGLVKFHRVPPEKIEVIGEGVDLSRFHPGEDGWTFRKAFGIPEDAILFGAAGMFRTEKGHHVYVKAAAMVKRTHPHIFFVLVGGRAGSEGRTTEHLPVWLKEAFPQDMPSPVILTGYQKEMSPIMAALDVLIVPSRNEAQSRVVPEAFATGKPVIASRTGGLPELVRHGWNGLLVTPGHPEELADAIRMMADDTSLRCQYSQNALQFARENLSIDAMMEKTLAVYSGVVKRR